MMFKQEIKKKEKKKKKKDNGEGKRIIFLFIGCHSPIMQQSGGTGNTPSHIGNDITGS